MNKLLFVKIARGDKSFALRISKDWIISNALFIDRGFEIVYIKRTIKEIVDFYKYDSVLIEIY